MKRIPLAALLAIIAFAAQAMPVATVGRIDYVEGNVTISRAGKVNTAPNIEDPIQSGDLIKTAGDGLLVIALDRNTGMSGSLTVRSRSSLYVKLESSNGQPKTSVDVLAGSIGSKVKKIAGAPKLDVVTQGAVMAVRGTEFGVTISVNEAVLVACVEGKVSVSAGADEVSVPAGKAVEQREGKGIKFIPVAVSSIEQFSKNWITEEIAAFKSDPVRAIVDYEKRYSAKLTEFEAAYAPFQKSVVLKKWLDEDKLGSKPNAMDPATLREKKEMAAYLLDLRRVLFIFERIYYRVDELMDIVRGTEYERASLRKGLTIGDFLASVLAERDQLARKVALYRYAEALYQSRNPDGDVFSSGDDF